MLSFYFGKQNRAQPVVFFIHWLFDFIISLNGKHFSRFTYKMFKTKFVWEFNKFFKSKLLLAFFRFSFSKRRVTFFRSEEVDKTCLRSSIEGQETDEQEASAESGQRNGMSGHVVEGSIGIEATFSRTNDDTRHLCSILLTILNKVHFDIPWVILKSSW